MEFLPDYETAELTVRGWLFWLRTRVFSWSVMAQIGIILVHFALATYLANKVKDRATERFSQSFGAARRITGFVQRLLARLPRLIRWGLFFILLWLTAEIIDRTETVYIDSWLLRTGASLTFAWIAISLLAAIIKTNVLARLAATVVWIVTALNILQLLDPTIDIFDKAAISVGDVRVSVLMVIKGVLSLAVLLWVATALSDVMERRFRAVTELTPSVQVLLSKLTKVTLVLLAIVVGLKTIGVDLTAFAFFSGALGVGIGFGLQKVISNLVSGIILLMDKSIKPGDVVAVQQTYGWVKSFGARYASVITRDGIEHLIPNEEFITQRVENWSYTDSKVRLKIPIGVSYDSDLRLAAKLAIEAASECKRVIDDPAPKCLLIEFGDNSVNLELRVWIADPREGVRNIRSEILFIVWDKFHEAGVKFPFPQRDLHVKGPVAVTMATADSEG
jgi:small-conductance mechanosensitive channel